MAAAYCIDPAACRTVREALRAAATCLADAGVPEAAVDARHLVMHALGTNRAALLREPERPLDADACERLNRALARRADREPVSRIIGERAFRGLTLSLGADTLDPRPDTETVVTVARHLAEGIGDRAGDTLRILDLGTGSGAIVLALLAEIPGSTAIGIDISDCALAVARHNAERCGLANRVEFIRSHWLDAVEGRYHVIVANPPYIPTGDIAALAPEVAQWDPRAALDGGPDGLDAYRAILAGVQRVLEPQGWAVLEIGQGQESAVVGIAERAGLGAAPLDWPLLRDLNGTIRCIAVTTVGYNAKKGLGIAVQSV